MKNTKDSGRSVANENKNIAGNFTVMDSHRQELTINEKLEMMNRVNKSITDKVVKSALKRAEKHLINGEDESAANELKKVVEATGDIRPRLPLALMQYYELGGERYDLDMLLYNHRLAAAEGYIPSMHMLGELYKERIVADVYHEGQIMSNRAAILDPLGKLKHHLHDILAPNVTDREEQVANIIKAIHEPANHFYNHEEAGKYAALLDISTSPNRRFVEVTGGAQCMEWLGESVEHLHAGNYQEVERILKKAKELDVVAGNSHLATLYIGLGKKKQAFRCVDIAVAFGSVSLMYTLSAMYRCGYGVRKYSFMADAWYWKAVEWDIDSRGLRTAILLNE